MKTYLVTGGAGFIGSNIAAALTIKYPNDRIAICDTYDNGDKWRNNVKHLVDEFITPGEIFYWLEMHSDTLEAIIHMGGVASTTETNSNLALENNVSFSKVLRNWCIENKKRFIYASSASTYGAGEHGFDDDDSLEYLQKLRPLHTQAWSQCAFDYYIARTKSFGELQPLQSVGLKFFNVYGPNEYHKAEQRSVALQIFPHAREGLAVKLFKSYNKEYADGGQLRDFVYVKDCANVVLWLLENPQVSGLFNVGSGKARSFKDLAEAVFKAVNKPTNIHYIDMPEAIKDKYQYFTEAKMDRLLAAGYDIPFSTLEEGIADYVQNYLLQPDHYL